MEQQLPNSLKDSNIVVTGAGRGLGAALALALSDMGGNVVLCGRSLAALDVIAGHIKERTGHYPKKILLDLADIASVDTASKEIIRSVQIVDILINNGATWLEHRQTPYSASEVMSVIGSTVTGTFLFTQALLPALEQSKRPDVVTIGSISGLPNASLYNAGVPFHAAKQGQTALADGLRQIFWGTPVRSICIHPPWLKDISPLDADWDAVSTRTKSEQATNCDIVDAVAYAITRPRHITIASMIIDSDSHGMDYRSHLGT
jgi:NADP-dependent 3-hydroxy acid dehydrogenase YdfG